MANIVGMQRAIKEFFEYLLENPDLIPDKNVGQFIQALFHKIVMPTLNACLKAKGEKVSGNPAHVLAETFYQSARYFLTNLVYIMNTRMERQQAARHLRPQMRMAMVAGFVQAQREMILKGPFGGGILFVLDPDSPKPKSQGFKLSSFSSFDDDTFNRESLFVAANKFYLCHSILGASACCDDITEEGLLGYHEAFVNLALLKDLPNASIQERNELCPLLMQSLEKILALNVILGNKYLIQMLSIPLHQQVVEQFFLIKSVRTFFDELKSEDILQILKANVFGLVISAKLVAKLTDADFMLLWDHFHQVHNCPDLMEELLLAGFLEGADTLTDDDLVHVLSYYFKAPHFEKYFKRYNFNECLDQLSSNVLFKLCDALSVEHLKLALRTFPQLHLLNKLSRSKDVDDVAENRGLVLQVCQSDVAHFALVKNVDFIKLCLNHEICIALWRHQSLHDLVTVVEITYDQITAPDYNLLELVVQSIPAETIAKIYQRVGGNAKMQAVFKLEFDRHCLERPLLEFAQFMRRLITSQHLTAQKLSLLYDNLLMPYFSKYLGQNALDLLIAITQPEMNNDLNLAIAPEIAKLIATSLFGQLVREISNFAKDQGNVAVLSRLHLMPTSVAENLFGQLKFSEIDLTRLIVNENFQRQNPLHSAYHHGNQFNPYAGRSLVTEYLHELGNPYAVARSIKNADTPLDIDPSKNLSVNILAVMDEKVKAESFSPLIYHYRNHNILYTRKDVLEIVFASNNLNLMEQYCWKFILYGHSAEMLNLLLQYLGMLCDRSDSVEFINAKLIAALIRKAYHLNAFEAPTQFVNKLLTCGIRSSAFEQLPCLRALIGQLIVWDQKNNRQQVFIQRKRYQKSEGKSFWNASCLGSVEGSFGGSVLRKRPQDIFQTTFLTAMCDHLQTFAVLFATPANVHAFLQEYETATPLLTRNREARGRPLPDHYVIRLFIKLLAVKEDGQRLGQMFADSLTMNEIEQVLTQWVDPAKADDLKFLMLFLNACAPVILVNRENALLFVSKAREPARQHVLHFMYTQLNYGFAQTATIETMIADMNTCVAENGELARLFFEHKVWADKIIDTEQHLVDFLRAISAADVVTFFVWLKTLKPAEKNAVPYFQQVVTLLSLQQITDVIRSADVFSAELAKSMLLPKIIGMMQSPDQIHRDEVGLCIIRLLYRKFSNAKALANFLFIGSCAELSTALTVEHLVTAINTLGNDDHQCAVEIIHAFPVSGPAASERKLQLLNLTFCQEIRWPVLRTALLEKMIFALDISDKNDCWLRQYFNQAENLAFKPIEMIFVLVKIVAALAAARDQNSKRLAAVINKILCQIFNLTHAEGFFAQCGSFQVANELLGYLDHPVCAQFINAIIADEHLGENISDFSHVLMQLCLQHVLDRKQLNSFGLRPANIAKYLASIQFYNTPDEWHEDIKKLRLRIMQLFTRQHSYELIAEQLERQHKPHLDVVEICNIIVDHLHFAVQNNLITAKVMDHFESMMVASVDSPLLDAAKRHVFCERIKQVQTEKDWKQCSLFINRFMAILYNKERFFATCKNILLTCPATVYVEVFDAIFRPCLASLNLHNALELYQDFVLPNWGAIQDNSMWFYSLCTRLLNVNFEEITIYQQLVKKQIEPKVIDMLLRDFAKANIKYTSKRVSCGHFMYSMLLLLKHDVVLPESVMNVIDYLLSTNLDSKDTFMLCCHNATFTLLAPSQVNSIGEQVYLANVLRQRRLAEGHIFIENDIMYDNRAVALLPITADDFRSWLNAFERRPGNTQAVSALLHSMHEYLHTDKTPATVSVASVFAAFDLLDGHLNHSNNI